MQEKLMSLTQASNLVTDNMLLAMGGNAMHRNPTLFSLALSQKQLKGLKLCGAAPGIATDILMPQSDTVYFGFLGFENEAGLASGMRKGMEGEGQVKAIEGS